MTDQLHTEENLAQGQNSSIFGIGGWVGPDLAWMFWGRPTFHDMQ
jgi:hypothetical protein